MIIGMFKNTTFPASILSDHRMNIDTIQYNTLKVYVFIYPQLIFDIIILA